MRTARTLPPLLSLRAFESAARHLSFSKAADELCVTQSAVSRHVRNLEDHIQRRLFIRQGRFVLLSEDGKRYFDKISAGLSVIEDATASLMARNKASVLTVDVLPTLGMRWLAPRLHQFSQAHPSIELHLITSIEPVNFTSSATNVAIRVGRPKEPAGVRRSPQSVGEQFAKIDLEMLDDWEGIQHEFLFPDTLVAVYNPELVIPPTSPRNLSHSTLISTVTRGRAWQDWFNIGGIGDIKPRKTLSFGHFFMSLQAAIEGRGIAILPEVLIEPELASGRLKILFHKAESEGGYFLLFRKSAMQEKRVAYFRRWAVQAAAEYRRRVDTLGGATVGDATSPGPQIIAF